MSDTIDLSTSEILNQVHTLGNIKIRSGKAISGQQRRFHINAMLAILLMIWFENHMRLVNKRL
jgi:hypothetical protein